MIDFSRIDGLFSHSLFVAFNREWEMDAEQLQLTSRLILPANIYQFHPARTSEFIQGRMCASMAYKKLTGRDLLELKAGDNRQPLWPPDVVGTISHNKHWVGAAVASSAELIGVGMDFEVMGRTRDDIAGYITNSNDVKNVEDLTSAELLTLIFSAKESLYKALFPSVKKFFGFEAAAVTALDPVSKTFDIELLAPLNDEFSPLRRSKFAGRYERDQQSCLTIIEVLHS